jgi:hypothetical protein
MKPMPRTFEDHLRERRARIATWLSQRTEADIVIGLCERWVRDLVESGREPHARHDIPGLPPELDLAIRLSDAGLHTYSDALAWQIAGGEGIEPAEAPLIGHALAVASGRAFVAYGAAKLHWIGHLVSTIDGQAWEAFADSAAAALCEDTGARNAFVEFLLEIVREANEAPDRVTETPSRRVSMASLVEEFVRSGSFQDVWYAGSAPVFFRSNDAFEILRRAEPQRFLEMIDELPHPALVEECLSSRALMDKREDVLGLLRLARPAFDADGSWQRSGMAAVLLVQLASTQLLSTDALPNPTTKPSAAPALPQEATEAEDLTQAITLFRQAADGLLDILFGRPDGAELGWHWLEYILRELPRYRRHGGDQKSPRLIINRIGILVHALSSRLAPRRTQDMWIAEAAPPIRQYRVVAVLSVAAFSTMEGGLDIGAVARGILKSGGFELTRASELINLPGAPLRTIPGDALARIPDVAAWLTRTWSALRFEREQAWPTLARRGVDANPAHIMGVWGLGIVESLGADETRQDELRAIWQALEAVLREARLVEPRMGKDFWGQAVARLFSWWPRLNVLTSAPTEPETPSATSAALGRALACYVGINDDFMGIVVSLYQSGIDMPTLDTAVRATGQDLLRMIRRFVEAARGLKDARLWNQDWVAVLVKIETLIAAQRSANAGPRRDAEHRT